jgi:hypothetical protein
MIPGPREVFSELSRAYSAIFRSLDTPNLPHLEGEDFERIQHAYKWLSQARNLLRVPTVRLREADPAYFQHILREVQSIIEQVESDLRTSAALNKVPFRITGPKQHRYGEPLLHEALLLGDISVAQALRYLDASIDAIPFEYLGNYAEEGPAPITNLSRLVPKKQAIAPVQFDIQKNKLVIVHVPANLAQEDRGNAGAARNDLLSRGEQIIDQLKQSNCDQRLLQSIEELQAKLASEADIIQLGLAGIACGIMCEQFQPELPEAVCAMMKTQAVGVSMYAAQFPEWQRFTEQAATVSLTEVDVERIAEAASNIIQGLQANKSLADPEVPRTLAALRALIEDPKKATKRAAYAVWRTLENLLIKVFGYGAELLDQTAKKSIDKLSTAGARTIVALVGVALAGAIVMSPIAAQIPESSWIAQAAGVVKAQIEHLKAPH